MQETGRPRSRRVAERERAMVASPVRTNYPPPAVRTWVLEESPGRYVEGEVPDPEPADGEVRVRLMASALNHMDIWVTKGMPKPHVPHVPGADGAGIVDRVGPGVRGISEGDEVVLNPAVACGTCSQCLRGESP